jgi:Uma2 family endonuclease
MNIQPEYATVTPQEFFAWVPGQEGRYELVEGEVVMMAGAGRRHDAIVVNLIAAVRPQTGGGPGQTFTGDTYVATTGSNRRMPDMGIDCGKPDDNSLMADKPSLVVEVLSPTTGGFDVTIKLAEYQGVPSLDYILFVDTENPTIHLYRRGNGGLWQDEVLKGLDAVVEGFRAATGHLRRT